MDESDEFMNRFLDEFTKWRKEKGYASLTTLAQQHSKEMLEKRFWQEIEEFKKERQDDGAVIAN